MVAMLAQIITLNNMNLKIASLDYIVSVCQFDSVPLLHVYLILETILEREMYFTVSFCISWDTSLMAGKNQKGIMLQKLLSGRVDTA